MQQTNYEMSATSSHQREPTISPSLPKATELPWSGVVAQNFAKHRHPIPPEVVDYAYSEVNLNPDDLVLDLGCGTGLLAMELVNRSRKVTGIDISKAMLAEADRALANHPHKDRLTLSDTPLERLIQLGIEFKGVFICRAFFAMPREAILKALDSVVSADGAVILIDDPNFYQAKEPWQKAVRKVTQAHFESRELPPLLRTNQEILQNSSFSNLTENVLRISRDWNVDRVLGVLYSTGLGAVAANAAEPNRKCFEAAIHHEMTTLHPSGTWTEQAEFEVIIARRGGK